MKTGKKNLLSQRQLIEKKLRAWLKLRAEKAPQSGWLKAIRGALGMNTRQLADLLGIDHAGVLRLEKREAEGKASFEFVEKAAHAMGCKLIYAIVPEDHYQDLNSILDERAKSLAAELLKKVEHSMRLEKQGSNSEDSRLQLDQLAQDLKLKQDSRIWNQRGSIRQKKNQRKT